MNRARLLDEDTRKHKQELVKAFLKHKSQKECHFTKLNELKVNQKWRDILRKSKSKELQREVEEMNTCFREVLKHKDIMIDILQREHEEADRQHSLVTRQHFINTDKLIDSKAHRANLNQTDFKLKLEIIKEKFTLQLEKLGETQTESLDAINQIRSELDENHIKRETQIVARYLQMEEDLVEMDKKDKFIMRNNMENKLNAIWADLQRALLKYLFDTKERRDVYERMKERNEKCLHDIQEQKLTIQNYNDTIDTLQQNISETRSSYEGNAESLKKEKDKLQRYAKELKLILKKTKTNQQNTLKKLVVESEQAVDHLQGICEMGNSTLKIHSQCERLERNHFSFEEDEVNERENAKDFTNVLKAMTFFDTDELQLQLLENFWNNYNANAHRNKKIEKEITLLSLKNEELQLELKKNIYGMNDSTSITYTQPSPKFSN